MPATVTQRKRREVSARSYRTSEEARERLALAMAVRSRRLGRALTVDRFLIWLLRQHLAAEGKHLRRAGEDQRAVFAECAARARKPVAPFTGPPAKARQVYE